MSEIELSLISSLHFENNLSQQEIAQRLSLSKMTVSRVLQKAKETGVVNIRVKSPFSFNSTLGKEIEEKYGIEKAIIVKKVNPEGLTGADLVASMHAYYLAISDLEKTVLGIGGGNTIGKMVRHLVSIHTKSLHIVQLIGGLSAVDYKNPLTLMQEICRKLDARGTYLTSFATVENKELRDSIFHSSMGKKILKMWDTCTDALFGIGAIEKGTFLSPELVQDEEFKTLKQLGAIGDVLGYCFDIQGKFIKTKLEDRLVSIPMNMLMKIPRRVALSVGVDKVTTTHGALMTGVITTFITDENTAKLVLKK
jgi:DNA-binding transcriptional regulator LsrR (DeoR family)